MLDASSFVSDAFNLIIAPCGSGKTTAAINTIAALASSPRKALFLIDTQNGNLRLAQNEALTLPYAFFAETAGRSITWGELPPEKIVVTTYAQFGVWVRENPDFAARFEVIICDEAHNIVVFPTFSPQPNFASIARDAICKAAANPDIMVVGITATPEPLDKLACPQHIVPIDSSELRQYENHSIQSYSSLPKILASIPGGKVGMLYVPHIRMMKECAAIALAAGHNPICVWSTANKDHTMNEEQLAARDYILEHEEIPPSYDLFIFNGSCETSINIRGKVDYFVAHTSSLTHITQTRGRYRGDLETLYVFDRNSEEPLVVPDEFLDIQLFHEDQQELRLRLSIKDAKGHYLSYSKQWERIETSGYTVDYGRNDNKRYVVIRKLSSMECGNP